jgi:hypothetical protein
MSAKALPRSAKPSPSLKLRLGLEGKASDRSAPNRKKAMEIGSALKEINSNVILATAPPEV